MSDEYSFFVVGIEQLIIGRYRNEKNINLVHMILLGGCFSLMMLIYIIMLRKRLITYKKKKESIPMDHLPLMKEDIGENMFNVMLNHILFVDSILSSDKKLIPEVNEGINVGDPSWGADEDGETEIHYNSYISKSFYSLENVALIRRPDLMHEKYNTIREYINVLKNTFPSLNEELCQEYIHIYEQAVYSDKIFIRNEYIRFKKIVNLMINMINENDEDL